MRLGLIDCLPVLLNCAVLPEVKLFGPLRMREATALAAFGVFGGGRGISTGFLGRILVGWGLDALIAIYEKPDLEVDG